MKLIIFGSRYYDDFENFKKHMYYYLRDKQVDLIISGGCDTGKPTYTRDNGKEICGADGMAERYAALYGIPFKSFDPDWKTYGKAAGPIRNSEMAKAGTDALGFWDGIKKGRGTTDMEKKVKNLRGEMIDYSIKLR